MENKNMTASSLDPKAALLVVDLQKAILGLPAVHPIDGIVNKAVALAEAFRAQAAGRPHQCRRHSTWSR
jgi:nicotinamidase-related amidase